MRRRKLLTVGGAIVFGTLAGCSGGDEKEPESTPATEEESGDTATPKESADGETTFQVDTPATEIDWGEQYEVTVTASGGEDPTTMGTVMVYQTESDSMWSGGYDNTEFLWQLDAGETTAETFEVQPTAVGDHTMALMTSNQEVVAEWQLTVHPPTAPLGETISYYDGLDLTLDAEIHEWIDFKISWWGSDESVVRPITPENGKWVKVNVVAENTNTNEEVALPGYDKFSGLGGNSQLDKLRAIGTEVGANTNYIVDDERNDSEKADLRMHYDGVVQQDGYWYPPSDLVSGAVEEGWFVFTTEEAITVDDLQIRANRAGIEVRATWTNK